MVLKWDAGRQGGDGGRDREREGKQGCKGGGYNLKKTTVEGEWGLKQRDTG